MELVIAEKPSVAKSIAGVIGANERKQGYNQGGGYIVTWCVGHLMELAKPEAYDEKYGKSWRYADLPILPEKWIYEPVESTKSQLSVISELLKRSEVSAVICATDAGREGELIFRLVYNYCKSKKPIKRLWISSMEEKAISDGFKNLKDGKEYERLYQSAVCRQQADWLVGMNGTRLFSALYGATLAVGRVQSPTVAMIAERERSISNFRKEPFYDVEIDCGGFKAVGERLKDKPAAEAVRAACDGQQATIGAVDGKNKTVSPLKLYDLTTLQREANRLFGFTAQETLDYTQSLYEKKFLTYPRTDSRFLTEDMAAGLPSLVKGAAAKLPFIASLANDDNAIPINTAQVVNNSKVTDHHAIIPTPTMAEASAETLADLPSGERDILNLVSVRLVCAVGDKHAYRETTVTVNCAGSAFTARGKVVTADGWKIFERAFRSSLKNKLGSADVGDTDSDGADGNGGENLSALPNLTENAAIARVSAQLRESFTTPPKHFTEDSLLAAMENADGGEDYQDMETERKGLGTPATRAAIIEKMIKSELITRDKKNILPTEKGTNLVKILPETLKSPLLTAEWEQKLKFVERGELTDKAFAAEISGMITALVAQNSAPNPAFIDLFPKRQPAKQGDPIGKCPRCGAVVYEYEKGFFCENRDCKFALWKDNKFFSAKKKTLTKTAAKELLEKGKTMQKGLFSEKTGKTYDAYIVLDDSGGQYVNFKMEFINSDKGKGNDKGKGKK